MMKFIKGSTSPKAEEKTFYELSGLVPDFSNPIFNNKPKEKYIWTLFKQDKTTGWKQVSNNIKYGEKVPYTFGEKVVGIPYRIEVHTEAKNLLNVTEKKFVANLVVTPRTAKEPVIGRVILLNRENYDVNKAKFSESLSAEARTSNLFGKEITFYLWEEGASESDKYKKPKKAFVDKNGIAKVTFSLSEYATPKTLMDFFTGDKSTTKKFFVTAVYENKKVNNKGAVEVSEGGKTPAPQTNKPTGGIYGLIEKTAEVVAEGIEKIGSAITEQTKSPAIVKAAPKQEEKEETCVCKKYDLIWGDKIGCNERKKVVEVAENLGVDPNWLMTIIAIETIETFNPAIQNKYGYTGLIQIGDAAADTIGTTTDALKRMPFIEQMDYVQKHLSQNRFNGKIKTLTDLYLAVLYPNACGHGGERDYVVLKGTAYKNNPVFFKEDDEWVTKIVKGKVKKIRGPKEDGKTYVWEVEMVAKEKYTKGLGNKEDIFTCNKSNDNKATDTSDADIEYHIFNKGGGIQYKIHNAKRQSAEYFYHDVNSKIHSLGKYKLNKIADNYGGTYKDRIGGNNIYLIDIRTVKNYSKDEVKFKLGINTNRYYINDVTLAALLGAMLDCSYTDFTFNGFSNEKGQSIGGSKSHKNGMHGDLRYLRKDKSGKGVHIDLSSETGDPCGWKGMDETRQNKFNDALYKYGWKSMLSWRYNGKILNHAKHFENHNHHLHVQSFTPNLKEISKDE